MIGRLANAVRKMLPEGVVEWLYWRRASASLPGGGGLNGKQTVDAICAGIDVARLSALREETRPELDLDPEAAAKYFDHRTWLRRSIEQAARLGLHREKGLRVLDIGCGPGWFLAVARHFGHECAGMDLPLDMTRPGDRRAYTAIPEILHCSDRITRAPVEAFTPIPLEGPFDLITCFLVCFDGHWQEDAWGVDEWAYFLRDAFRLLAPGGRLYLQLNAKPDVHPELVYYDRATRDLFASKGDVDGRYVLITRP